MSLKLLCSVVKALGDFEEAKKWVCDKLWNEWLPEASDIYHKSDFNCILFRKFDKEADRDKVVAWFRKLSTKIGESSILSMRP